MHKRFSKIINSPLNYPILFFILIILIGSMVLYFCPNKSAMPRSYTDSIFTATSAACVTGLSVVDIGTSFDFWGQLTILCLMQMGGLGIMTFTSLSLYLWRQKTTITDRIAVGQVLLHDPKFNLGTFLVEIFSWTFIIEAVGALSLYWASPKSFSPFSAVFHSVSAFCNGGFSLFQDNLQAWKGDWGVNAVFMALIIIGGIGFSVFIEYKTYLSHRLTHWKSDVKPRLSWYSKMVMKTTIFLILFGGAMLFISEFIGYDRMMAIDDAFLTALFQSVTCRTAGVQHTGHREHDQCLASFSSSSDVYRRRTRLLRRRDQGHHV